MTQYNLSDPVCYVAVILFLTDGTMWDDDSVLTIKLPLTADERASRLGTRLVMKELRRCLMKVPPQETGECSS